MLRDEIANLIRENYEVGDTFYTKELLEHDEEGTHTPQQVGPIMKSLNLGNYGVKISDSEFDSDGTTIWKVEEIDDIVSNNSIR